MICPIGHAYNVCYHLGSQMRKHISIDNKKMLQDKIHYICLLKYACRPYKNQKQRKENNHKLIVTIIISAVNITRVQCFLLNVSATHDFLCVHFIYIWKPCYHALAAWKLLFTEIIFIHTIEQFLYISTTEKKINTRLHTLEGHLCIQ